MTARHQAIRLLQHDIFISFVINFRSSHGG